MGKVYPGERLLEVLERDTVYLYVAFLDNGFLVVLLLVLVFIMKGLWGNAFLKDFPICNFLFCGVFLYPTRRQNAFSSSFFPSFFVVSRYQSIPLNLAKCYEIFMASMPFFLWCGRTNNPAHIHPNYTICKLKHLISLLDKRVIGKERQFFY